MGNSPPAIAVSCAVSLAWPIQVADGVWIRDRAEADLTPVATSGKIGRLDVSIVQPDVPKAGASNPSPMLAVAVRSPSADLWISVGIGADPSIARTILHSIHAAEDASVAPPSTPTPTATTTMTTPAAASTTSTSDTVDDSTTTTAAVQLDPNPIRVTIADGCPASVANHPDYGSTSAQWISNPDSSGLDQQFVPGTPRSAIICRYVALDAMTTANGQTYNVGTLLTSTVLDANNAGALADTLNAIVPWNLTSGCEPPSDKAATPQSRSRSLAAATSTYG